MSSVTRSVARVAALFLVPTLGWSVSAGADTIQVTSGALQFGVTFGQIAVAGDREFTLQAGVDVTGGIYMPWEACSVPACGPGAAIPLLASWSDNDLPGVATLDGNTYPRLGDPSGAQSATVRFDGQAIAPPLGPGNTAVVSAPFTFSGWFFQPTEGLNSVRHDLVGDGVATLWLEKNIEGTTWRAVASRYDFQPVPTPEPATLGLVGSGLALAFARRRLRGSRR